MKLFDIDGPLYKLMVAISNLVLLNFCWIIGTVIGLGTTIGVSTVAACDVGMKIVKGEEGYIHKQFIKAYKANLKQGIPLGLLNLLAVYAVYLDFEFFNKVENATIFLLIVGMFSAAFFAASFVYSYPITARYSNTLMKTMRNSFRICTKFFGRSFLMFLCLALEILAFLWNGKTIFLGFLFGPAGLVMTVCAFAVPIFKKIEKTSEEEQN